uniref:Lysozyme-Protease Inhibitor Protein n=1 Tax=Coptotermes formosanus TaxID=36987 RepID=UPI0003C73AA1|nr:Chain A, Lysozyme-Protease Inhibitor Protein [Coptotermes formosanus]
MAHHHHHHVDDDDKPEDCQLFCPMIYAPICATDGVSQRTFSNPCDLKVYNCWNPDNPYKEVKVGECDDANKPVPI